VGGESHAPAALPPGKETRYPLYSRLGGPQGRSGRVWKISSPTGFDPRTVQPVESRYTDYDIAAHVYIYIYSRWGRNFPPVQTSPGVQQASCKMGTDSFPGVKCGRGALLTTYPLLLPRSWKSRAIPLGHTGPVTGKLYLYLYIYAFILS